MAEKGIGSLLFTAGAGALATVAGIYVGRKVKRYFSRKPKMKLFEHHLNLSTRCTWLIAELGAEDDFERTIEPLYPANDSPTELLMLQDAETFERDRRKQEERLQLVQYMPYRDDDDATDYEYDYDHSSVTSYSRHPPTVVNDEFTMIEGAAICMYLADLYGKFLPDTEHKAEYYSWIVYSAATFDSLMKTLHQQIVDTPISQRSPELLESALHGFHAFARALSHTLDNRQYLCGDKFTAADCVLGFTLWWAFTIEHGRLLEGYPILAAYLDRLRGRPAFQKTFGTSVVPEWDWGRYIKAYVKSASQSF